MMLMNIAFHASLTFLGLFFRLFISKLILIDLYDMKTKKRAMRRVADVPPLESVDVCVFAEKEGVPVLDLRLGNSVGGLGSVGVPLDSVSKRQCRGRLATGRDPVAVRPVEWSNTKSRGKGHTFDVGSPCCYTLPGFSKQPFQDTMHVANGEMPHDTCKDFGPHANARPPVQIRSASYVCCPILLCFSLFCF